MTVRDDAQREFRSQPIVKSKEKKSKKKRGVRRPRSRSADDDVQQQPVPQAPVPLHPCHSTPGRSTLASLPEKLYLNMDVLQIILEFLATISWLLECRRVCSAWGDATVNAVEFLNGKNRTSIEANLIVKEESQAANKELVCAAMVLFGPWLCVLSVQPQFAPRLPWRLLSAMPNLETLEWQVNLEGCAELKLPSQLKTLGDRIFTGRDDTTIDRVVFPVGMQKIGLKCFEGFASLRHVEVPASVETIGDDFLVASAVERVDFDHERSALRSVGSFFMADTPIRQVVLPSSVREVGEHLFSSCLHLHSVALPPTTFIPRCALKSCLSLARVTIPQSCISIGDRFAFGATNLERIDFEPVAVLSSVGNEFASGTRIRSIALPPSLTSLGSMFLSDCRRLTAVDLPDSITSLGDSCLEDCVSLQSVKFPAGLVVAGDFLLTGCSSLQSMTLPHPTVLNIRLHLSAAFFFPPPGFKIIHSPPPPSKSADSEI
jgi:hypothetical protein